jgi:hypothetical protein
MSMPTAFNASTAAGLIWSAGSEPAEWTSIFVAGEVAQPAGGHLVAVGVVDADRQDGGLGRHL